LSADGGGPCTVIAVARVPEDRAADFVRLQERISAAMARTPGFLGKELIRPRAGLQEDWVSIFRFVSTASLREWFSSPERQAMVRELQDCTGAAPSIQVVAGDNEETPPVAVIFSHHVKEGREDAFRVWREGMLRAIAQAPGFLGADVFDRREGVQDQWVHIVRFDSPASLERWMCSRERERQLERLPEIVEHYTSQPLASGLGMWFHFDDSPGPEVAEPPRWKQILLVTLALYPTVITLTVLLEAPARHLPFPVHMVMANLISVSLLTWPIMPWLNRRLGWWLRGGAEAWRGTVLVAALLTGMVTVFTLAWAGKFSF
jgi:antibiotic biosynthesis monooxygenase (ABM) superfamily enzyme